MAAKYFEDLEIWQEARRLTNKIYDITKQPALSKDFSLCNQIRRASVSIMSNIAEGYERGGNQEFLQYLSIAKGSCGEARCQLYIVIDQCYAEREECEKLIDRLKKLSIMIHNFMSYLKESPFRGAKYKTTNQKSIKKELEEIFNEVDRETV